MQGNNVTHFVTMENYGFQKRFAYASVYPKEFLVLDADFLSTLYLRATSPRSRRSVQGSPLS